MKNSHIYKKEQKQQTTVQTSGMEVRSSGLTLESISFNQNLTNLALNGSEENNLI
jgi:hypothetical protein